MFAAFALGFPLAPAFCQNIPAALAVAKPDVNPAPQITTDTTPLCSKRDWTINDLAPYLGFSEINGVSQTVEQLIYARSQCFNSNSLNRWKLQASIAHVGGRDFRAEVGSIGVGVELHPLSNTPGFSITPIARVEYDRLNGADDRIAWGGEITVENILPLDSVERSALVIDEKGEASTKLILVPGNQLIVAVRGAYRRENSLGLNANFVAGNRNQLTGFALIGWDGHFKGGRTRWGTNVSYQSIEGGLIKGYSSTAFSLRKLDKSFQNFNRVYQIIGNFGGRGYRGIILSVDFRFK